MMFSGCSQDVLMYLSGPVGLVGPYLLFVTDTTDGVCVKKIARCKFLQI